MKIAKAIRHIISWLTPYGIVSAYKEKKYRRLHNFIEFFKQYVKSEQKCEFVEDSPYETIVSVQGFGYSGSGAVVDLLREYDSTHVIGLVDLEGSMTKQTIKCAEVDILRLAGGLFEVEKYIGSNNIFQNDALLHRVVAQIESSDIYCNNPSIRPYCFEFMSRICEILTDSPQSQLYNPYLNHRGANDILFLKNFTILEYRDWCRKLLNSIFTEIRHASGEKPILVLDQIMNDWEFDTERYKDYIPNLKIIMVYRDPRDVYAFAKKNNVGWIPHKTVDVFVAWYRILLKHCHLNEHDKYYVVSFNKLIYQYESVVSEIEQYVGLSENSHSRKGQCLDCSFSRRNMNIWKNDNNEADYQVITDQLSLLIS